MEVNISQEVCTRWPSRDNMWAVWQRGTWLMCVCITASCTLIVYPVKYHYSRCKNSEWLKVGKIDLNTIWMVNSMCINNEGVFISMYHPYSNINTIFVYNHEAQNMKEFANQSQSRWRPCVCSVDSHSNLRVLLLDDKSTKTLLVYFKEENKWHEIMTESSSLTTWFWAWE